MIKISYNLKGNLRSVKVPESATLKQIRRAVIKRAKLCSRDYRVTLRKNGLGYYASIEPSASFTSIELCSDKAIFRKHESRFRSEGDKTSLGTAPSFHLDMKKRA